MESSLSISDFQQTLDEIKSVIYGDVGVGGGSGGGGDDQAGASFIHDVSEILDLSNVDLEDNETWLMPPKSAQIFSSTSVDKPKTASNTTIKLNNTADELIALLAPLKLSDSPATMKISSVDSRTFTRPKKHTIQTYNNNHNTDQSGRTNEPNTILNSTHLNGSRTSTTTIKPNFDFTEPNCNYFPSNKMLQSAGAYSNFLQDCTPPSLMNSLCSSTFATLMDNGYIKNDPILCEIRDTDYTESVLMNDSDHSIYHSLTESCSSMNSDVADRFLNKIEVPQTALSATNELPVRIVDLEQSNHDKPKKVCDRKLRSTFTKADLNEGTIIRNFPLKQESYQRLSMKAFAENDSDNNYTYTSPNYGATFKKSSSLTPERVLDANVTCNSDTKSGLGGKNRVLKSTFTLADVKSGNIKWGDGRSNVTPQNKSLSVSPKKTENDKLILNITNTLSNYKNSDVLNGGKQSPDVLSGTTDSSDQLEFMSTSYTSSTSSKGSTQLPTPPPFNHMTKMSTPRTDSAGKNSSPWSDNDAISPIRTKSDPDFLHCEDDNNLSDKLTKNNNNTFRKEIHSVNMLKNARNVERNNVNDAGKWNNNNNNNNNNLRYPLTNLKRANIVGSQPNLGRIGSANRMSTTDHIYSDNINNNRHNSNNNNNNNGNLKTLRQTLKGSYTNLRPLSVHMPTVTQLNTNTSEDIKNNHLTTKNSNSNQMRTTTTDNKAAKNTGIGDGNVNKPQLRSGLPRPVGTGIPRPVSRIPAPVNMKSNVKSGMQQPIYKK